MGNRGCTRTWTVQANEIAVDRRLMQDASRALLVGNGGQERQKDCGELCSGVFCGIVAGLPKDSHLRRPATKENRTDSEKQQPRPTASSTFLEPTMVDGTSCSWKTRINAYKQSLGCYRRRHKRALETAFTEEQARCHVGI